MEPFLDVMVGHICVLNQCPGLPSSAILNISLMYYHKHYADGVPHATTRVGSFWWRDILKLHDAYTPIASVHINMGDSALFWTNAWHIGGSSRPLCWRLPRLFSFVNNDKVSVHEFLISQDIFSMFFLPLSQEAAQELHVLEDWIMALDRNINIPDVWVWPGKSGAFSAKSFYTLMHSHLPTIQPCKWLWKSRCTLKIKVFGWLLFFDRLNTKDLLIRRHWRSPLNDNLCVICQELSYEDMLHLFFNCNFGRRVWNYLSIDWSRGPDILQCIQHARSSFRHTFFFEVILTAAWNIWILRNGRTFRGERATFAAWRSNFVHDLTLLDPQEWKNKHYISKTYNVLNQFVIDQQNLVDSFTY
ncbi:uncharacterized protein LOC119268121 [Triticum dicoccoides]|uniref:uncharacterized protein LOC119268121 n=1 Tax=Triticum dicoccoides TaxID=85692 RepID=UPI00188F39E3|nr:uncharacterized protein LOC119268121 [Triticum dicoccoides]XP_037405531.1 uncharacterized protein LOC119268121 [Triticum dicoccoides]